MNDVSVARSQMAMSFRFHIAVFRGGKVRTPERDTVRRAMQKKCTGKKPTTQAGEFDREEMHHIREGKHGARSTKQAIAIDLSAESTRSHAKRDYRKGQAGPKPKAAPSRSRTTLGALKREKHHAASWNALSQQARRTAHRQRAA